MVIVITGNPGVGKHAVARELSQRGGMEIIDINEVAKSEGLYERDGSTCDVDTEKLKGILGLKISSRSDVVAVVVVGHLAPYVLDKSHVKVAIVLRRSPYDLLRVYGRRGYSKKKSQENAGSEILGVTAFDAREQFEETVEIDVTNRGIHSIVKDVESIISGEGGSGQVVDWLGPVTGNGDLGRFFAD